MTAAIPLRPGLQFFPDCESYDEEIARLRHELGRPPTQDDIARDLSLAVASLAEGSPCLGCGSKDAHGSAAWKPGNVDSLIGFGVCAACAKVDSALDDAVEVLRTLRARLDAIGAAARKDGDGDVAGLCARVLGDAQLEVVAVGALVCAARREVGSP